MSLRLSAALSLALLLCTSAAAEPAGAGEWRLRRVTPVRDAAVLQRVMLETHNRARAELGLPPLAWSATLAAGAGDHALTMARSGRLVHSTPPPGAVWRGENLFAGTRDGYGYAEMVRMWLDERRDFVNRPSPRFSRTGRWQDVVHYAQIVWRDTTELGCAMAAGRYDDFLVCRYAPGGEVRGQRAY